MLKDKPTPHIKVSLRPAATIDVTIVDADGNPLEAQWLIRLQAVDGRRFIPPGGDPHLSSFASSIWSRMPDLRTNMGLSRGFTFTELDKGRYSIEALKFKLVDKPTPQNIWEPVITYHGSIPSLKIEAGQSRQVKLSPQDNRTRLTVIPTEFPDKLFDKLERSSQMPLVCLVSRSPELMLWDNEKIFHLEDHRLGRIDKKRFFRGFFPQDKPLTIENLPPGPYSFFAMAVYGPVVGCLLPLGASAMIPRRHTIVRSISRFFAGFCLIANGAYISIGAFDRVGDCGEMLRTGAPLWTLLAFGAVTVPLGLYVWHRLGSLKHSVNNPTLIEGRTAYVTCGVLIALIAAGLALSPR